MRLLIAATLIALAACTTGPRDRTDLRPSADPSAVIATELAFARAAQEKGQWTAFREYAAKDAVMFVPGPVNAQDWLKKQTDPPRAVAWQPHQVWSSCDGSLAVTKGAWQRPDGSIGYFTTVWQRQDDRSYKWVMDQGDTLDEPLEAPDFIDATVAECGVEPMPNTDISVPGWTYLSNSSRDGSLVWVTKVRPDCSRELHGSLQKGARNETFAQAEVVGEAGADCSR